MSGIENTGLKDNTGQGLERQGKDDAGNRRERDKGEILLNAASQLPSEFNMASADQVSPKGFCLRLMASA